MASRRRPGPARQLARYEPHPHQIVFHQDTHKYRALVSGVGAGILVTGNVGDNTVSAGVNVNIMSPIIESGRGCPAITLERVKNVTIQNGYFERQSTNQRTIEINNCQNIEVNNCNFQNTLGIQIKASNTVFLRNVNVYDNEESYTEYKALRVIGGSGRSSNIHVEDFYLNKTKIKGLPIEDISNYSKPTIKDIFVINRNPFRTLNFFNDPVFTEKTTGTLRASTTAEFTNNGLKIKFELDSAYQWTDFLNLYTHPATAPTEKLYLIAKIKSTGQNLKSMQIRPSSGTSKSVEIEANNLWQDYYIVSINAIAGVTYSVRFSLTDTALTDNETLEITDVFLGFSGLRDLMNTRQKYIMSPNGTLYKLNVDDAGVLSATVV